MATSTTKLPTNARPGVKPGKVEPPAKNTVVAKVATPTAETKKVRENRATRDACAVSRKELLITDKLAPTAKVNNARAGSLRYNIIEAVRRSNTVGAALTQKVRGTGKFADTDYTVKKVDVGFCLGNGFVTATK